MTIYSTAGVAAARGSTSIAYAASITPVLFGVGDGVYQVGALTGNITINNPTGTPVDGQVIRFRLSQDATGGRTITWGAAYNFGTDIPANAVPSAASSNWEMTFTYNAAATAWRCTSIVRGF